MSDLASPELQKSGSQPDVARLIHARIPYEDFDASRFPLDLQGWYGEHPVFGAIVERVQADLVIEVGSWKGQSSVSLGKALEALGPGRQLLCVDTWLGAGEFWDDHDDMRYQGLGLVNGFPSVYYQFLANMVHTGLQDVVVPFPVPSTLGARWCQRRGIQADVIYVDASHEYEDVAQDLHQWWPNLRPGGVLFGDDYTEYWPGVKRAVAEWSQATGIEHAVIDNHYWLLQKPV